MTPYPLRALPTAAVPHCRGGVLGLSCWLPAGGSGSLAGVDFKLFGDVDICLHEELSCEMLAASRDPPQQEHQQSQQQPQQPQAE